VLFGTLASGGFPVNAHPDDQSWSIPFGLLEISKIEFASNKESVGQAGPRLKVPHLLLFFS
jgi:hypothetical protein